MRRLYADAGTAVVLVSVVELPIVDYLASKEKVDAEWTSFLHH
jgi:hypothetical protein